MIRAGAFNQRHGDGQFELSPRPSRRTGSFFQNGQTLSCYASSALIRSILFLLAVLTVMTRDCLLCKYHHTWTGRQTPQTGQTTSVHINTHPLYGISSSERHDGRVVRRVRGHGQNQYDDASNTRRLRCDTLSRTLGTCPRSQRTRKLWQVYAITAVACPSTFSRPLFVYHDYELDKQLRVHTRR